MQYWEEMSTKFGFSDGECIPDGIEVYRDVYMKTVNRLAEHLGSDCRVVPFDRSGVHNYCLWCFVSKRWFETVFLPSQKPGQQWSSATNDDVQAAEADFHDTADERMQEAVGKAFELNVDQYVDVQVELSPDFKDFLETCHREIVGTQAV